MCRENINSFHWTYVHMHTSIFPCIICKPDKMCEKYFAMKQISSFKTIIYNPYKLFRKQATSCPDHTWFKTCHLLFPASLLSFCARLAAQEGSERLLPRSPRQYCDIRLHVLSILLRKWGCPVWSVCKSRYRYILAMCQSWLRKAAGNRLCWVKNDKRDLRYKPHTRLGIGIPDLGT